MSSSKKRFLGIHLGGAKSNQTSVVVFDVFREQQSEKSDFRFLVDVFDKIQPSPEQEPDSELFRLIVDHQEHLCSIGVDAPLTMPPFFSCEESCLGFDDCQSPGVVWLRDELKERMSKPRNGKRPRPVAPYVERPVDVYLRKYLGEGFGQITVIEALGASMASKTARMQYVQKIMKHRFQMKTKWVESNPTLSLYCMKEFFSLSNRDLQLYRDMEHGASIRLRILDRLNAKKNIFLYENDVNEMVQSLPAFYAFLSAYTAYLEHMNFVEPPEEGFPVETGWVAIPKIPKTFFSPGE